MTVMTDVQSVAANTTSTNVLAGKVEEFLPGPSRLQLAITASAVGLQVTFIVGNRVMVEDQEISDGNRFPLEPDDVIAASFGVGGDRLVLRLHNTTAGAITVKTKINIEPV